MLSIFVFSFCNLMSIQAKKIYWTWVIKNLGFLTWDQQVQYVLISFS